MKKIISLLLSLLILASAFSSLLIAPTSAFEDYQAEAYFENPANWQLFDETATNLSSPVSDWATVSKSSLTVSGETEDVIKLNALNHRAAIYLPDLKKNTEYTFSFKYYSETKHSSNYIFKDMVLFNTDFANATIGWNYNTPNGVKEYVSFNGYYVWNDDYSSATTKWDNASKTISAVAGAWNTYSLTFNTGDYENYATVLLSKVENVYLNDFSLVEKVVTAEEYFTNPSNWNLDIDTATKISNSSTTAWTSITKSQVTVGGNTVNALKLHTMNHRASVYLPNLKKNTEYTFSFKYYSETEASAGYIFKDMVLFAADFENATIGWSYNTPNGVKEYVSHNGYYVWNDDYTNATTKWDDGSKTIAAVAGSWNTYSLTFNTGDYQNYATVLLSKVNDVYLYDFTLTEKEVSAEEYFTNPDNWKRDYESATSITDTHSSWTSLAKTQVTVGGTAEDAIKLFTKNHRTSIAIPNLEKYTDYTFTFRYYADQTTEVSSGYNAIFKEMILFNTEYENATIGWSTGTPNGVKHYISYNGGYRWNDDYSAMSWIEESERTTAAVAGQWNEVSFTFNTGDYKEYSIILVPKVENVYLNQFEVVNNNTPTTPTPTPTPDPEPDEMDYYENPENWNLDAENAPTITDSSTTSWTSMKNTKVTVGGDEVDAIELHTLNHRASIYIPELEKQTKYTLSFRYYSDNTVKVHGDYEGIFKEMVLFAADYDNATIGWSTGTPNGVKHYISYNGGYRWNDDYSAMSWIAESERTTSAVAGQWNEVSFTFNTGDYTKYAIVLISKVEYVYLDNFSLTAETNGEAYYETPSNWHIDDYVDKNSEGSATIGFKPCKWRKITTDTTVTNSSDTSLKVEANNGFTSIYLPGELKANTDYTFTFDYYFDDADIKNLGSGATGVFDRYGIYAADATNACFKWSSPGFLNYVSYNGSYTTTDFSNRTWGSKTTSVNEGGKWYTVNLVFNSVNFKKLAFVFQTKTNVVYMDNFVLSEGLPEEETFHNGPQEQIIVDFEKDWNYVASNVKNRMQIAETTGKDGQKTTALQIYEGDYPSSAGVTFINWATVNSGTDEVFSIPVKGGQTYEFSVDVKMSEYSEETDQRLLLYADYANPTTLMEMIYYASADSGVGEGWKTYTFKFAALDGATVASFGLNAGLKHPEIWIDNLTLTEAEADPPFHDPEDDPIVIDFERDYNYFSGNMVERYEVAETIGMGGKKTNALHIFEGDYIDTKQVTFINWSAITADIDPVFTVPVKERTPYKISAKVKIEEWAEEKIDYSRLFLFYYDYNNRETDDKSLARGYYYNLMGNGWVEYSVEFVTDVGQETISFGINAGLSHPEIWIDDITVDAYTRGIMGETTATYVEEGFNLISEGNFKTSATINQKAVMEIPVKELSKFTFGVTAKGNGKIHLAFDADCNEMIQTINLSNTEKRYGYNFYTGNGEDFAYVIFEPEAGGITYKDLTFFAARAVSFGTDMGLTEKPIEDVTPSYTIKYVDADDAIKGVTIDGYYDSSDSDTIDSPQTGDYTNVYVVILASFIAGCLLLLCGRKKQKTN